MADPLFVCFPGATDFLLLIVGLGDCEQQAPFSVTGDPVMEKVQVALVDLISRTLRVVTVRLAFSVEFIPLSLTGLKPDTAIKARKRQVTAKNSFVVFISQKLM